MVSGFQGLTTSFLSQDSSSCSKKQHIKQGEKLREVDHHWLLGTVYGSSQKPKPVTEAICKKHSESSFSGGKEIALADITIFLMLTVL